ncbi:hypothetical protein BGZ58_006581, partial [Dissophora ornata]
MSALTSNTMAVSLSGHPPRSSSLTLTPVHLTSGSLRARAPPLPARRTLALTLPSPRPTGRMVAPGPFPTVMAPALLALSDLISLALEVSLFVRPSVSPPRSPASSLPPLRTVSSVLVSTPLSRSAVSRPSWTTPLLPVFLPSPLSQSSCHRSV